MKIEVSKNMLAGALAALGKLVSRMSPVEEYKSVRIVLENRIMRFHTCGLAETMEFTLNSEAEGSFRQIVHFDALQKAERERQGSRLDVEPGILLVNGIPVSPIQIESLEDDPIITAPSRLREGGQFVCHGEWLYYKSHLIKLLFLCQCCRFFMINDLRGKIRSLELRRWSTIFLTSSRLDTPFCFFVLTLFVAESQHFPREYHPNREFYLMFVMNL